MKIGILTFHRDPNHGAFLQAFALMKFLQNGGHDVQIINYENKIYRLKKLTSWFKYRRPIRFVDRMRKDIVFKKDREKMELTKYSTNSREIHEMQFDIVIIGSDVVWDYKHFGYDDLFFGGVNTNYKISYAASFGTVKSDEKKLEQVLNGMQRFSKISVRDYNSQKIVEGLIGTKPEIVVDPTFLIDFSEFENLSDRVKKNKKYILIYAYEVDYKYVVLILNIARKNNLKTISIGYRNDWCDSNYIDVGPFEWLSFIKYAELIFTSTFHGTVFSIKYKKNFYAIETKSNSNKLNFLLDELGLSNKKLSKSNINDLDLYRIDFDFNKVHDILKDKIKKSTDFLLQSINS